MSTNAAHDNSVSHSTVKACVSVLKAAAEDQSNKPATLLRKPFQRPEKNKPNTETCTLQYFAKYRTMPSAVQCTVHSHALHVETKNHCIPRVLEPTVTG